MRLEVLYKIRSNPNNIKYLRENSNWYKYLNRNPMYYKEFENEMKEKYELTLEDKINKISDSIDMMSKIIDILN